ncbi:leader peptidase (prepilin peptidase)/N-methyltransferase [Rhizomicrobium palustre]|uniref:Leader peptidase (Prepilin peptidase)/N-methyltransferase n=1 Tax=Rhizomicrobium palustre TaxID=189966 RepID=A0A846N168_9PROT|nr:prepilin peptidase [Rhizomicrobium palustre]NIK88982.1 leader peptidase (prepilin peptidase)/N-methyltransferase [Rhizomicrobium palustre]
MTADPQLWLSLFLIAPIVGSFLGVVIQRLPDGQPILWARSKCDSCSHSLSWYDLFPIFSWIFLRGRCRYCGAKLGVFFPAIELAALLPVAAGLSITVPSVKSVLLGWAIIPILVLDCTGRPVTLVLGLALALLGLATHMAWATVVSMAIALPVAGLVACLHEDNISTSAARGILPLGLATWLHGTQVIATIAMSALLVVPIAIWGNRLPAAIEHISWRSPAILCAWLTCLYGPIFLV